MGGGHDSLPARFAFAGEEHVAPQLESEQAPDAVGDVVAAGDLEVEEFVEGGEAGLYGPELIRDIVSESLKGGGYDVLSGGNDVIAKPIMPTELCVKAITHLLRNHPAT